MTPEALALLGTVAVAIIGYIGQRLVVKANESQSTLTHLARRVEVLEGKVEERDKTIDEQQTITQTLVRFVDHFGWWAAQGFRGPAPQPPRALHDYLDTEPWRSLTPPHQEGDANG